MDLQQKQQRQRNLTLNASGKVSACPECGNDREFRLKSTSLFDGLYSVWMECRCGFDPTAEFRGVRAECTHPTLDRSCAKSCLRVWNLAMAQVIPPAQYYRLGSAFS